MVLHAFGDEGREGPGGSRKQSYRAAYNVIPQDTVAYRDQKAEGAAVHAALPVYLIGGGDAGVDIAGSSCSWSIHSRLPADPDFYVPTAYRPV